MLKIVDAPAIFVSLIIVVTSGCCGGEALCPCQEQLWRDHSVRAVGRGTQRA